MFIGHFAPALVARGLTEEAPKLGTLFVAGQLVDWAFFTFAIVGVEHMRLVPGITAMNSLDLYHMPYTHSLVGSAAFALVFGLALLLLLRNMVAATWGAIVVMSHWGLDWLVHRPDLTIAGGAEKLGLGLWNRPLIEMPLEIGLVLVAFWFYFRRTKGPVVPPFLMLGTMLLFQAIDWFGPAPKEVGFAMYATALFAFSVITALAYWVQSTRWHKQELGLAVSSARR